MKRSIYLVALLAFVLRMGLAVTASSLLPVAGYDSKTRQAGYLFFDAYRRDSQSWDLAQSAKPLIKAFDDKFSSDQYGGLLWVSAFIYRYLSGGTHQPLLVILLGALIGALGVPFVYLAARRWAGERTAMIAALLFAFFPEAILLGASQMREPYLMTFIAMFFYGVTEWQAARGKLPAQTPAIRGAGRGFQVWLWMILALAGMLLVSPAFAAVSIGVSAGWLFFADSSSDKAQRKIPWQMIAVGAGIFALALVVLAASWGSLVAAKGGGIFGTLGSWARETTRLNAYLLGRSSGIVQLLFQALPTALALPFVAVYGILQPVLPAAIFEPSIPFWQTLGIVRALGWYLLLPLVAFAPIAAFALPAGQRRKQWLWLSLVVWVWILIAALRGGGDQWDNPRYRVILFAWIVMLAAMAFQQIKSGVGRWFWRICAVEAVILLVFGHWYTWRYLGLGFNIGIRNTLVIAIGLSILVVLGDWLWARRKISK